jgi:ABC-type multidrug transport system fused ATPase/permease subunit
VTRLPVRFFDSTKSGVLVSRVMNDAEGIRNLVGTGLVQLVGRLLTAGFALAALLWLNWRLTLVIVGVLARLRRGDGVRLQAPAPDLPRARRDQRRGDRPPHRDVAASASSRRTPPRSASSASSPAASTGCSATSRTITGVSAVTLVRHGGDRHVGVAIIIVGGARSSPGEMTLGDSSCTSSSPGLLAGR